MNGGNCCNKKDSKWYFFSLLELQIRITHVVFCSTSRSKVFDWETVSTVSFIKLVRSQPATKSAKRRTTKELLLFPVLQPSALQSLSLRHLFVEKKASKN